MEKKLYLGRLHGYTGKSLQADLFAGLTVAAIAVPQAMAYALIAGIDPRFGLYTAIVLTAIGSLFSSSRHLINGPTNAISLVVFSAVAVLGPLSHDQALQAVFLLAVMVGLLQILIYALKLGDLTRYVSEAVVLGFMAGAALLVALSQVPHLLGLHPRGAGDQHLLHRLWLTFQEGGPIRRSSVTIGMITILVAALLRRVRTRTKVPFPDMLLALIVASVAAWWMGYRESWPAFPPGLPAFHVPAAPLDWVRELAGSALAIALLGLLEALAIAKSIAARTREPLDYNRQCLAEGLANLGAGFFQCMPGSGSLTRSAINYQAGAVTRFSGVLAAGVVALVVVLLAPLVDHVPKPALAGTLLVTTWRLVDYSRIGYCLRATRFDAGILVTTTVVAVFISIEFSILIGTLLSCLLYMPRAARLQASELVLSSERVVRERLPSDPRCPSLVLFSLEGELFFGAAPELDAYLDELRRRVEQGARVIVLRLKRARNPDMVCLEHLQHFLQDMQARRVPVLLCGVRPDFAAVLKNLRFYDWLPEDHVFLEDASAGSATLKAVRRAYELLGTDLCSVCPRRNEKDPEKGEWYYMI
jgi:SulP family sulfate permease